MDLEFLFFPDQLAMSVIPLKCLLSSFLCLLAVPTTNLESKFSPSCSLCLQILPIPSHPVTMTVCGYQVHEIYNASLWFLNSKTAWIE